MKTVGRGKSTSAVEVTNISGLGFWLLINERELFVPYEHFPWFKEAAIGQLLQVEMPNPDHLYWPDLDVDLAVESIKHPELFPLVSKAWPNNTLQRKRAQTGLRRKSSSRGARR